MEQYKIKCEEEQAYKALKLGAHLRIFSNRGQISDETAKKWDMFNVGIVTYRLPSAEEMIGWIESNTHITQILIDGMEGTWGYRIYKVTTSDALEANCYKTRKEATIAAIDAALDYLLKKNV